MKVCTLHLSTVWQALHYIAWMPSTIIFGTHEL